MKSKAQKEKLETQKKYMRWGNIVGTAKIS